MRSVLRGRAAILPLIAVAACTSGDKSATADSATDSSPQATSGAATGSASVSLR